MDKIKHNRWVAYMFIGIYLMLSPFMGFPSIVENAIFVVLGSVVIWLSVIEPEKVE
ncbi:MAG: hypothetical protein WCO84_00035 [bacterium]